MAQVTTLGDSPTDYVAAGTRSGDFMGVPKTKASAQGNKIDDIFSNINFFYKVERCILIKIIF